MATTPLQSKDQESGKPDSSHVGVNFSGNGFCSKGDHKNLLALIGSIATRKEPKGLKPKATAEISVAYGLGAKFFKFSLDDSEADAFWNICRQMVKTIGAEKTGPPIAISTIYSENGGGGP